MTSTEFTALCFTCLFQLMGAVTFATRRPDPHSALCGYHEVFHFFVVLAGLSVIVCNYSIVKRHGDAYWLDTHIHQLHVWGGNHSSHIISLELHHLALTTTTLYWQRNGGIFWPVPMSCSWVLHFFSNQIHIHLLTVTPGSMLQFFNYLVSTTMPLNGIMEVLKDHHINVHTWYISLPHLTIFYLAIYILL